MIINVDITVEPKEREMTLTMGEFRELTSDVPDEWPLILAIREDDDFDFAPVEATVHMTGRCVEIIDDTYVEVSERGAS